jgi:hypothetical protein
MEPARKASLKAIMKPVMKAANMRKMINGSEMAYWPEMMEVVVDIDEDREAGRKTKGETIEAGIVVGDIEARIVTNGASWRPVDRLIDDATAGGLLRDVPASVRLLACLTSQRLRLAVDGRRRAVLTALWQAGNRCRCELGHRRAALRRGRARCHDSRSAHGVSITWTWRDDVGLRNCAGSRRCAAARRWIGGSRTPSQYACCRAN